MRLFLADPGWSPQVMLENSWTFECAGEMSEVKSIPGGLYQSGSLFSRQVRLHGHWQRTDFFIYAREEGETVLLYSANTGRGAMPLTSFRKFVGNSIWCEEWDGIRYVVEVF